MRFSTAVLPVMALAGPAMAQSLNTTREFYLVAHAKPGQDKQCGNSTRFNGLEITAYHSGAGENDAVLTAQGNPVYFNATTAAPKVDGHGFHDLYFDLDTEYTWAMSLVYDDLYAAWDPVVINIGDGGINPLYFVNATGLQASFDPSVPAGEDSFGGWLVCEWWRGVPQLFMRLRGYEAVRPSNCLGVFLHLRYI